jgi:predicted nucleic acid-binding protein
MNYLLDTCVLSEFVKKMPNPKVVQWINQQQAEQLFVSQISIAEIKKGLHKIKVQQPDRHHKLQQWLHSIEATFPQSWSGFITPTGTFENLTTS